MFHYLEALRVESWLGWVFNFGLGSVLFGLPPIGIAALVLFAFSLATGSVFVLNQYFDRDADQENKVKSSLPVASGRITPKRTLIFSFFLVAMSLALVLLSNVNILPLFVVYLGLWTAYSTPPLRLKSVPVADFVLSGVGAGFLPFLMGLGLTDKQISGSSILLSAMPLILFHCGGHIIQAVGDYEADLKTGVHTFVVEYGRKKGVIVAGLMFLAATSAPFIYSALGLLSPRHLILFPLILPLLVPIILRYVDLLRNPSTKNVVNVQKTTKKYGIIVVTLIWGYALLTRVAGI